ncbi:hypothetical protein [Agarivorans sp. 1_MG-2023]|uniref:hypothetical protein n=1 Tax=Agarivorans sp. 1_MG-2023 TaxID=3062634 RepID=UPI0026E3C758|nr:hypothetical protein [Agarivorans sp. 1_MG-2023]MDO6765347.1 hypothetical protein [Agarivorans sp. 1_MG-2023]
MELKLNAESFDEHQMILIGEIIDRVKSDLKLAGVKDEQLKEMVGNIAFSIATTLDNSSTTEFDGVVVNPYLVFQTQDNELTHCGGNSYMHEYVFGILDEVFES